MIMSDGEMVDMWEGECWNWGVPRRRGRPKRRWMDVIREDMEKAGIGEGEVKTGGCGG